MSMQVPSDAVGKVQGAEGGAEGAKAADKLPVPKRPEPPLSPRVASSDVLDKFKELNRKVDIGFFSKAVLYMFGSDQEKSAYSAAKTRLSDFCNSLGVTEKTMNKLMKYSKASDSEVLSSSMNMLQKATDNLDIYDDTRFKGDPKIEAARKELDTTLRTLRATVGTKDSGDFVNRFGEPSTDYARTQAFTKEMNLDSDTVDQAAWNTAYNKKVDGLRQALQDTRAALDKYEKARADYISPTVLSTRQQSISSNKGDIGATKERLKWGSLEQAAAVPLPSKTPAEKAVDSLIAQANRHFAKADQYVQQIGSAKSVKEINDLSKKIDKELAQAEALGKQARAAFERLPTKTS